MGIAKKIRMGQGVVAVALCLPAILTGCVTLPSTDSLMSLNHEPPCQIVTTWQPDVIQTQDAVNDGRPLLGLGGRLYIFGKEIGKPLKTKGSVVVDLYDLSKSQSEEPVHLERWTMDAHVLTQLGRVDPLGFGYTLFLPWSTCRPEVTQVLLKVKFQPKNAHTLYTESGPITINHPGSLLNSPEYQMKMSQKVYSGEEFQALQNQKQPVQSSGNPGQPGANPNRFAPGDYAPGNRLAQPNQGLPPPNTQSGAIDRSNGNSNFQSGQNPGQDNRLAPNGRFDYGRPDYRAQESQQDNANGRNSSWNRSGGAGIPVGTAPARAGFAPSQNLSESALPLAPAPQAVPSSQPGNSPGQGGPSLGSPPGAQGSPSSQVVPRFAIVPSSSGR